MTSIATTTARSPASLGGLASRGRAALGAARAHAGGDAYARAMGWAVNLTPGGFGLSGRSHRDPRFGTPEAHGRARRARTADKRAGRRERSDA